MEELSREFLEMLPPLILLFFLAFSPGIMRLIQNRRLKKGSSQNKVSLTNNQVSEKVDADSATLSSESLPPGRILHDSREITSGTDITSPLKRVETLPPLQKAFVWSEILGNPGGKGLK